MATIFVLSVVPNPLFEIAGWTAGATRYPFWKFMASVTPGKVARGLLLAYAGANVFDWLLDLFDPVVSSIREQEQLGAASNPWGLGSLPCGRNQGPNTNSQKPVRPGLTPQCAQARMPCAGRERRRWRGPPQRWR